MEQENVIGNRPPKKSCIFKANDPANAASAINRVGVMDQFRYVQNNEMLPIAAAEAQVRLIFISTFLAS